MVVTLMAAAEMGEGAVVVALAMADAGAVAVGEDDRDQHHIRGQRRCICGRLGDAQGSRFAGRPLAPEEHCVAMLEPWQAVALASAKPGDDPGGADLVFQRMIGSDDTGAD